MIAYIRIDLVLQQPKILRPRSYYVGPVDLDSLGRVILRRFESRMWRSTTGDSGDGSGCFWYFQSVQDVGLTQYHNYKQ